jgi:D-3-phosphoglycerate dehydrogenase / 2-oxoglutarate reductase
MQDQIRIVLVENIHAVAHEKLTSEGFIVESLKHSPTEDELIGLAQKFDVIGLRSKTEITRKVLTQATRLSALGCFCIGTNQVQLEAALEFGIPVFNAPHSNTRSVAELVIAELVLLSRQICDRSQQAHLGAWQKSAEGSREVRGKTLGIIGYGHIGSQVSVMAESLGLRVLFFDVIKKLPLGNAKSCSQLNELLENSDFVTLHVPETAATKNMMGREQLKKMKKGSFLLNLSRGTVMDIDALAEALKSSHLAGAAVDVFPEEPSSNKDKFKSPLQGLSNVILTPHIGGSTEEAQYAIGLEVAASLTRFLKAGSTSGSVNFPSVDLPTNEGTARILNLHRNEPGVLSEINGVVSKFGANIIAQQLATNSQVGYLLMDFLGAEAAPLKDGIAKLPRSLRTRLL